MVVDSRHGDLAAVGTGRVPAAVGGAITSSLGGLAAVGTGRVPAAVGGAIIRKGVGFSLVPSSPLSVFLLKDGGKSGGTSGGRPSFSLVCSISSFENSPCNIPRDL